MSVKEYWNSRTIYRKTAIIAMALQLLVGLFFPFAKLNSISSYGSQLLYAAGLGNDLLPERFTIFSFIKYTFQVNGSDGMLLLIIPLLNIVLLALMILSKKRAGYVVTFFLWQLETMFNIVVVNLATDNSTLRYVYDVGMSAPAYALITLIAAVIEIDCILGVFLEMKAQAKLAVQAANGYVPAGGGSIDTEHLKEQAGKFANVGAAVAKKTAKEAVKGFYKASAAAKDFVETAKNESESRPEIKKADGKPQTDPMQKPVIPQSGMITGVKGMFGGAQIPLANGDEIVIGRDAEICHIVLEGQSISRKHCVIQYDGKTGHYIVTDYSANGTFLGNGSRLPKETPTPLSPGTVLWIGDAENTFQAG